jgi:hypothetical protein
VHEKAEPQMVAHERGHVCAQALARAKPAEQRARELRSALVVAEERHATVARSHLARQRLGRVVQQRSPTQRLATGHAVGERLGEQPRDRNAAPLERGRDVCCPRPLRRGRGRELRRGHLRARCSRGQGHRAALGDVGQGDRALEHLEGVVVYVGMVEAALLDVAQRVQLG